MKQNRGKKGNRGRGRGEAWSYRRSGGWGGAEEGALIPALAGSNASNLIPR